MKNEYDVLTGNFTFQHYLNDLVKTGEWSMQDLLEASLEDYLAEVAKEYGYDDDAFSISPCCKKINGFDSESMFEIMLPNYSRIQLTESGEYVLSYHNDVKEGVTFTGDDYIDSYRTYLYFAHKFDVDKNDLFVDMINDNEKITMQTMEALAVCILNDCQDILEKWDTPVMRVKIEYAKKAVK